MNRTLRVLFDITHPAHVHFFRNPIRMLADAGHAVKITSRAKDCTLELLNCFGLLHECLSTQNSGGLFDMGRELVSRDVRLYRAARKFRPDVLAAIGGIWAAQAGWALRKPSVVFYDTETARLQNGLTYPFATRIVVPQCYSGKLPAKRAVRYRGYHELSYLHPNHFIPDRRIALANGLATDGDTFLLRLVAWKASHDVGLNGWSNELLSVVVGELKKHGKVIISAEGDLPRQFESMRYSGDPSRIHHLTAYCRACIGESATMASEAVVLGVPAIYVAKESRGYVDEQANRYRLASIVSEHNLASVTAAIREVLALSPDEVGRRHAVLIQETVDVAAFVVQQLSEIGVKK